MSAVKMPWFRVYCDILEDAKILSLAFEDQRHFIAILALKSAGVIDQNCSEKMMNRIVAQKLWISHDAIDDVKRRLVDADLIDSDWQPKNWDKRQCRSDTDPTNADRQKRFRDKQKGVDLPLEHECENAKNNSNALCNAQVTGLDTDTEEEKEEKTLCEKSHRRTSALDRVSQADRFNLFWNAFADKRNRAAAEKAWSKLKPSAELAEQIIAGAARYAAYRDSVLVPTGGTPKMAQGWLTDRRWEDEIPDMEFTHDQQEFVETFNAAIGDVMVHSDPTAWTQQRAAMIDAALTKAPAEKWREFFEYVGHRCEFRFPADLYWLLNPENRMAVREGKYEKVNQR
jgi:hypothetical protein